jgi:hypothetical protein
MHDIRGFFAALALAAWCCAAPTLAQAPAAEPQSLNWLKTGQYASLDRHYTELQQQYEAGAVSDAELTQEYRALYQNAPANAAYFDRWVEAFPESYAAHIARGAYHYRMAWASRGSDYIENTSQLQLEAMSRELAQARPDLEASFWLTAKPYLTILYLLNVEMLEGSPENQRLLLDLGNRIDPGNTVLRARYMISLSPRWGGSYSQMRAFLGECRRLHLPDALLARLDAIIHNDQAEVYSRTADAAMKLDRWDRLLYRLHTGRWPPSTEALMAGALDHWEQTITLLQSAGDAPGAEELIGHARAAWYLHRRADADRSLALLAQMPIDEAWILSQMGHIYLEEKRLAEAWAVLQKAAALDDGWAQYIIGRTTILGCADIRLAPDAETGRTWMRRSAENGFGQAGTFMAFDHWGRWFGLLYLTMT